jgi:hypothetical protein
MPFASPSRPLARVRGASLRPRFALLAPTVLAATVAAGSAALFGCGVRVGWQNKATVCDRLRSRDPAHAGALANATAEDRVDDASCPNERGREKLYSTVGPFDVVAAAKAYDDRRPVDPLVAAFAAHALTVDEAPPSDAAARLGWTRLFVEQTDAAAVAGALAHVNVSDSARRTFVERYRRERDAILQKIADAKAADAAVRIEVEAPLAAWSARKKYYDAYRDLYDRVEKLSLEVSAALGRGEAPEALVRDLEAIRSEYVQRCPNEDCTYDPLYIEVTEKLASIHLGAKDGTRAKAETMLLTRPGALRGRFRYVVEAERAKRQFALEQAEATKPKPTGVLRFVEVDTKKASEPRPRWTEKDSLPDPSRVLIAQYGVDEGVVQKVTIANGAAKIAFQPQPTSWTEANCTDTDRVRRIRPDGTLEYEQVCTPGTTHTQADHVPEPIEVSTNEASAIKPGEIVVFAADREGSRAFVVFSHVRAGDRRKLVQVRGDRIPGGPAKGR